MHTPGSVTLDREHGCWIVALAGEHDLTTADQLREALESIFTPDSRQPCGPGPVVVDLTAVEFMDSSVVNVIIWAHDLAKQEPDAELVLVDAPGSFTTRLVGMLGLRWIMQIHPTRSHAVAALAGPLERSGA